MKQCLKTIKTRIFGEPVITDRTSKIVAERAQKIKEALNATRPEVNGLPNEKGIIHIYSNQGGEVRFDTIKAISHPDLLKEAKLIDLYGKPQTIRSSVPYYDSAIVPYKKPQHDLSVIARDPSRPVPQGTLSYPFPQIYSKPIPQIDGVAMLPKSEKQYYFTSIRHDTNWNTAQRIVKNNQTLVQELNANLSIAKTKPFSLDNDGMIIRDGVVVPHKTLLEYIEAMRKASN